MTEPSRPKETSMNGGKYRSVEEVERKFFPDVAERREARPPAPAVTGAKIAHEALNVVLREHRM